MENLRVLAPRLRAVLLDVDGTLIVSNEAHARAWAQALNEFGYEISAEQIRRWIGMGGDKILPRVDSALNDKHEPGKSIVERRGRIFLEHYVPHLEPTPGARELLDSLGASGVIRVAATSAKKAELEAMVKAVGIETRLDIWTTSDDAENSKPDPDIVEAALTKAKVDKTQALYLGDTPYDIEAAHKAGLPIVALECGGWSKGELSAADAIYETPGALLTGHAGRV
ncbi:MAG TPA: HAD family hydrolase [Candidatus Nitrosotalea sp.]|nr:HAD family hydrolase [Candidatus Nitrosotalea sp.]